jgi:hypothetical protein
VSAYVGGASGPVYLSISIVVLAAGRSSVAARSGDVRGRTRHGSFRRRRLGASRRNSVVRRGLDDLASLRAIIGAARVVSLYVAAHGTRGSSSPSSIA